MDRSREFELILQVVERQASIAAVVKQPREDHGREIDECSREHEVLEVDLATHAVMDTVQRHDVRHRLAASHNAGDEDLVGVGVPEHVGVVELPTSIDSSERSGAHTRHRDRITACRLVADVRRAVRRKLRVRHCAHCVEVGRGEQKAVGLTAAQRGTNRVVRGVDLVERQDLSVSLADDDP
jgi:hypothetical protein